MQSYRHILLVYPQCGSQAGRGLRDVGGKELLIGADGKTKKIFRKVKPEGHAEQVYEALQWA